VGDRDALPPATRRHEEDHTMTWDPNLTDALAPPWIPLDRDPRTVAIELLEEAHRELEARELAETLLEIRRLLGPLLDGRRPPAPARSLPAAAGGLSPAARAYARPIRVALTDAAGRLGLGAEEELRRLGAELELLTEDIASRPRGSAIPRV